MEEAYGRAGRAHGAQINTTSAGRSVEPRNFEPFPEDREIRRLVVELAEQRIYTDVAEIRRILATLIAQKVPDAVLELRRMVAQVTEQGIPRDASRDAWQRLIRSFGRPDEES